MLLGLMDHKVTDPVKFYFVSLHNFIDCLAEHFLIKLELVTIR